MPIATPHAAASSATRRTIVAIALVPVFCDNPACRTVWATGGFIGGSGATHISITNSKVGPCPNCGGMGSVPDGVYNLVNDALEVVSTSSGLGKDGLERLIASVRQASQTHESREAFDKRVATESPDLVPVVKVFMDQVRGGTWEQRLVTVLAILTLVLTYLQWQHPQQPADAPPPATAEQISQEVLQELQLHPLKPPAEGEGEMNKHMNETIRITDLATTSHVISDQEFINCLITGPAVLAPIQQTTISNCSLSGPPDEILWPMPPTQSGRVFGAVGLVNCTFERCRFEGIGFAGPAEFLEQMRSNLLGPPP